MLNHLEQRESHVLKPRDILNFLTKIRQICKNQVDIALKGNLMHLHYNKSIKNQAFQKTRLLFKLIKKN